MTRQLADIVKELTKNDHLVRRIGEIRDRFPDLIQAGNIRDIYVEPNKFGEENRLKEFMARFDRAIVGLLRTFHRREIFPSPEATYDLLFREFRGKKKPQNILRDVATRIEEVGLTAKSLVIQGLSDFGFDDIGVDLMFTKRLLSAAYRYKDFVMFAQANSMQAAKENIATAMRFFGLSSCGLDDELIDHFYRSRRLTWLTNNPLLIVQVRQTSSWRYENRQAITRLTEKSLGLLYLSKSIAESHDLPDRTNSWSTRLLNNFETRNINHYLILQKVKRRLVPECVPIHMRMSRLVETSRLGIDMPVELGEKSLSVLAPIEALLSEAHREVLGGGLDVHQAGANIYVRVLRSVAYFARSYQAEYYEDSILQLAVAFEILFGEGQIDQIQARLRNVIRFLVGEDPAIEDFKKLYNSRSGVAHEGSARDCDIDACRGLYVRLLTQVQKLIASGKIDVRAKEAFTSYGEKVVAEKLGFVPEMT